jgi:hypothetical protein
MPKRRRSSVIVAIRARWIDPACMRPLAFLIAHRGGIVEPPLLDCQLLGYPHSPNRLANARLSI